MRKLGVGVLGVGEMGKRHAENLRQLGARGTARGRSRPFSRTARGKPPMN